MTVRKNKTAILFDIDDTLYDQIIPFNRAVKKVFPHITGISEEDLFQARSRHGEVCFRMALNQEMTMEEMYRYRIQKAFEDFGIIVSDEQADAFQHVYAECQRQLELSPVMEQILTQCRKQQAILGIISNGPAEHQRAKARILGMERFMPPEHVIISGEVGYVKPDIRIFQLAQEQMGLNRDTMNIWYVGDSFSNDMVGAAKAGWKTIWLNRRRKSRPAELIDNMEITVPDYCVYDDEELAAVVDRIL